MAEPGRTVLTYGVLPDFDTFARAFEGLLGTDGVYHVSAGSGGLFQDTPHALCSGEEEDYTAITLYQVVEECIRTADACGEDAACLRDASDVLTTLGIEWI